MGDENVLKSGVLKLQDYKQAGPCSLTVAMHICVDTYPYTCSIISDYYLNVCIYM